MPLLNRLSCILINQKFLNARKLNLVNCGSIQLFHSNFLIDNNYIYNSDIQKYLHFIKNDNSYINKVKTSQREKLEKILELLELKRNVELELNKLKTVNHESNQELEKLVNEDKKNLENDIDCINQEILNNIIPDDNENENRNAELKITPAIGGDEAKLFSEELFNMYLNYIKYKNWTYTQAESRSENLETKGAHIKIIGDWVFNQMKYEAGVHRVQRVPETEKTGRTHTSTCSVVVLPELKPHEINIQSKDIIIEKTRSSGPGGQNVNKRESCVRVIHIPTGIAIENQTSRHQYENKALAIERLKETLYNIEREKILCEKKLIKKQQVVSNDYSNKIRTYHFSQNRVTDHRINYSVHNLKNFMTGTKELDLMLFKLKENHKIKQLQEHVAEVLESNEYKNFAQKQAGR